MSGKSTINTTFDGDTRKLERAMSQMEAKQARFEKKLADSNRRASASSARSWDQGSKSIMASQQAMGATIARFSGVMAAAFSAREVVQLADTFTQFKAKLINAKVAAEDMAGVQRQLFDAANANGTEVVALADLYGNLAMSAKSVGLSQDEMMLATEGVAAAMRLSGATTAQSSATILQLGQALAGGTVRAEEYNSMLENAPALVRAVAESSSRWAGDLGKLRKEINDGKVSSEAWANAIVAASNKLKTDAANAPLTVAASMQILENKLVEYIGKADQSLGASDKLAWALKTLGDNLDVAGDIAILLGAALVARLIPALLASGNAAAGSAVKMLAFQIAMQRSMTGSGAAMGTAVVMAGRLRTALAGVSAMAGGPLGIALVALVGGVMLARDRMAELDRRANELPASFATTTSAIDAYKNGQIEAAAKTGEASKQAWEHVRALKAEAEAMLLVSRQEAQRKIDQANQARANANRLAEEDTRRRSSGNQRSGNEGSWAQDAASRERAVSADRRADQLEAEGRQSAIAYDRAKALLESPVTPAGAGPGVTPAPSASGSGGGSGGSGTSAADRIKNGQDTIRAAEDTLRSALAALATTTDERLKFQLEGIKIDADREREALTQRVKDGEITQATGDLAKLSVDQAETARNTLATREALAETEAKLAAIADIRLQNDQELANLTEAYLSDMASMAKTVAEREQYEREALSLRQTAERQAFEARMATAANEWRLAGIVEDEITRRLAASKTAFDRQQTSETEAQQDGFDRSSPVGGYIDSLADLNTAFENVKADGLKSLEDGITDVITGAGDLKSVFSDLAKSIIADLVRIAVQQTIMKPLANWMSGGSSGGSGGAGAGNILGTIGKIFGFGRNAKGTDNWRGGLTMVGEQGPELMNLPGGTQIGSNHLLRNALASPTRSQSGPTVVNLTTNVDANNAVLREDIERRISQSQIEAVSAARKIVANDSQRSGRNRLR